MKLSHLSTVSALALALAFGGPAMAQTTAEQPADEPEIGVTEPAEPEVGVTDPAEPEVGVTDPAEPEVAEDIDRDRLALHELEDMLGQIGIEDTELFGGEVVVAHTEDGDPVIMLIGPEDFERGETATMEMGDFDQLRERLTETGFDHVRQDHAFQVLQGTLDGHHVFAASGDPEWDRDMMAEMGIGEPERGVTERAIGEPGVDTAEPGVTTEPDIDTAEPGITEEPGVDMAEPGMTEPGIDTAERDVTEDPGADTAERGVTTEPGVDTAEPGITTEPGVDTAEPGITTEPGVDTAEPGVAEEPGVDVAQPDIEETPRALARDFDRDDFQQRIDEAGIEDRTEFQGKLVFARTEDGQSLRLLIGPERFAGDEEIELTEDELRERLEDAGLTDVQVVEDDVAMFRGTYNDQTVLIIGGRGIMDDTMRLGALQPETDMPDMQPETGVTGMEPETGATDMEEAE